MQNSHNTDQIENVQIVSEVDAHGSGSWQPVEGEATRALGKKIAPGRIEPEEWETLKNEAISVLSRCVQPQTQHGQETGLVIGYVQSGKTLSFTTVAALARDNDYQMIIIIAGTSVNLRDQSTKRIEEDLDLQTHSTSAWHHFKSHELNPDDHTRIRDVLEDWEDPEIPKQERQTVLITVMKHHQHLERLESNLRRLSTLAVPTLVIDDEGDHASLNTMVNKGEASTTYRRILSLRECLPHHTFLQYTATPQAPLLINLIDVLSPNFAKVLSPGGRYIGGRAFFQNGQPHIRIIPENEIPTDDNPLDGPPESLLEALRIYILGVAAGTIPDSNRGRRTMMIHPSHRTIQHRQYLQWIHQIRQNWKEILGLDRDDQDYQDLLERFRASYYELQVTEPHLPSFEELTKRLRRAVRKTLTHEVNASGGSTPSIPWNNSYSHILVGGQAMDRGFTVEGLTVTYMPRGSGMGNADTIQQRARFFGYKEDEFGYCRVFLDSRVRDAYNHYVTHEESVRQLLIRHDETGTPLDEWKRVFLLDQSLRPTRNNILDVGYVQGNLGNRWFEPKAPHDPPQAIKSNQYIVDNFVSKYEFHDDLGNPQRTKYQKHHVAEVRLNDVYVDLLVSFRFPRFDDSQKFTTLLFLLGKYLESHPNASCTVYHMSKGHVRTRSLNPEGEILRLFQGRNPDKGPAIYQGDKAIKSPNCVTVQLHKLELKNDDKKTVAKNVPAIAVWLPHTVSEDWLVQNQGGLE